MHAPLLRPSVLLWFLTGLVALLSATGARAQLAQYSAYEQTLIRRELEQRKLDLEPEPSGKRVSDIELVRLEVLDELDPIPDIFNVFHGTTRHGVIRRELLFAEGQLFDQRAIDQTARNLRDIEQISAVLIVPVRDADPGRVRLLVITKDVWSLRPNWNARAGSEGLTYLYLNPSETNLLGTHSIFGATFELTRSTWALGARLAHKRLFGTRYYGEVSGSPIFNRDTGHSEGSYGRFRFGLPQYAESQRIRYGVEAAFVDNLVRNSRNDAQGDERTLIYHREFYYERITFTRGVGSRLRREFSFGVEAERRVNRPRLPADLDAATAQAFLRNDVPLSDTLLSPFVQLSIYKNDFLQTFDLEALGLQEDIRLGPRVILKVYGAAQAAGSTRDLIGTVAGASHTLRWGGSGVVRATVQNSLQIANARKHQGTLTASLRVASPRLGFGRLILDGLLENRYENYLRQRSGLGGEGRLRGFVAAEAEARGSSSFRGSNQVALNAEFRTAGVDILSAQVGLAVFHDMGATADSLRDLSFRRSAGLGLRVMLPQFDRIVLRADYGFPLSGGADPLGGRFWIALDQAFPFTELGVTPATTGSSI